MDGCTFEPSQDFSEVKKHFSMTRHCTEFSEDGSKEQEEYRNLMFREARLKSAGKKSRWGKMSQHTFINQTDEGPDPRPIDENDGDVVS